MKIWPSSSSLIQAAASALANELVAVSDKIEEKEELAKRANRERDCMDAMRSHFETVLANLQEEVETLTAEKAELFEQVSRQQASEETSNVLIIRQVISHFFEQLVNLRLF